MKKRTRKIKTNSKPINPFVPLSPSTKPSLAMDGTALTQISFMANKKYSQEIVDETGKIYILEKLKTLKKDEKKFLEEGRHQIIGLWKGIERLTTHTEMFTVTFHIAIGNILAEVESYFGKKFKYVRWPKSTASPRLVPDRTWQGRARTEITRRNLSKETFADFCHPDVV